LSDSVNLSLVLVSIDASSRGNLVAMQNYTNNINGRAFNFQSPMKDGSRWVVWFYADITRDRLPTEKEMIDAYKSEAN